MIFSADLGLNLLQLQLELGDCPLFVDLGIVSDVLGATPEPQSGECFLVVRRRRRASDDKRSLGVPAQCFLQQSGEFGVPVGDVGRPPVGECIDDHAQHGQTFVYVFGFVEALSFSPRLGDLFRACQVD